MEIDAAIEHVRLLLASGEDGEAVRVLERLVVVEPQAQDLLLPVAATLLDRGRPALAVRLAESVLEDDPWSARAHQVLVDALADSGDPLASISAARTWVDRIPDDVEAYLALSWSYLAVGDSVSAAEAAEAARNLDPLHAVGWLAMAWVARLDNRWEDVDRNCEQALLFDAGHEDALVMRAEALAQLGQGRAAHNLLDAVADPARRRRARRSIRRHGAANSLAVLLAVVMVAVGFLAGSALLAAVPLAAAVWALRRQRRPRHRSIGSPHPASVWGVVGLIVLCLWAGFR